LLDFLLQALDLLRRALGIYSQLGCGLVNQVYGLVGKMPV